MRQRGFDGRVRCERLRLLSKVETGNGHALAREPLEIASKPRQNGIDVAIRGVEPVENIRTLKVGLGPYIENNAVLFPNDVAGASGNDPNGKFSPCVKFSLTTAAAK